MFYFIFYFTLKSIERARLIKISLKEISLSSNSLLESYIHFLLIEISNKINHLPYKISVRIRVRIDSPHPLRMRPEKPKPRHSRCCIIKIPPCPKATSIGLNFAALHLQWWSLHIVKNSWAGCKTVNKQTKPYQV
jgi:hypothetical protein